MAIWNQKNTWQLSKELILVKNCWAIIKTDLKNAARLSAFPKCSQTCFAIFNFFFKSILLQMLRLKK